jgi:aminoglycoside 6-adenylyltransferase
MGYRVPEADVLAYCMAWAKTQDAVRALIMTSSRTAPQGKIDLFSDYDLILILTDITPFHQSRDWLAAFGTVLALFRDPIMQDGAFEHSGYVVQFEEGLRIDFTLMPVGLLERIVGEPQLPDEFDAGYRVLLDKDGLTARLKPPTYQAYIPQPPDESRYLEVIELCCLDATVAAKFLWRDDLIAAKHLIDHYIKQDYLLPVLEWCAEIEHGWTVKPGPYGRGLKRWLRRDLWDELAATYAGANTEANWEAVFRSLALLKRAATEVGDALGYAYPQAMHERTVAYIEQVRATPQEE